jgi:hypothetical protein
MFPIGQEFLAIMAALTVVFYCSVMVGLWGRQLGFQFTNGLYVGLIVGISLVIVFFIHNHGIV